MNIIRDNLRKPLVKERLLEEGTKLLVPDQYKVKKSDLSFYRQIPSGSIQIVFGIEDYFPLHYNFSFTILVWNDEILKLTEKFHEFTNSKSIPDWSAVIYEGDFVDEVEQKEIKFRAAFRNVVNSQLELEKGIRVSIDRLATHGLKLALALCDLNFFKDFYLSNPQKILRNLANTELFISCLMASLLLNHEGFHKLCEFLEAALDERKLQGVYMPQLFECINNARNFSKLM